MNGHPTGTVTFLFTDIEGSTRLAREFPETWESARSRHHQILRDAIESHNGFVFQVIGDSFCAAFHTAGDALKASVAAQQGLQSEMWRNCVIRVRMGIHTGQAKEQEGEYKGYLTLSLVQRLMSAGHGGQLLLSDTAQSSLQGELAETTDLQDLGKHYFKGFPDPLRVFQVLAQDLPADFPPLRTLNIRPTNLPIELTSFVGREKELADVKRLLQDSHMLTLIGPGGTGKTRLSIHAAGELLPEYPDGVWLIELAPILDPVFVPRTTALTLGLRDEPQRPVIDMLCDYLRDKKILIVLDNCEHLVDACARMADKILRAAPDARILASSREALGIGGEVTYRVPSLGLPDLDHLPPIESLSQYEAVKLFIDRATAVVQSFTVTNDNAPALAQICHHLDGIPLAIELAAAKVRVLSLEQIYERLDDRFRLLTGGSRTVLERHQTLRAAIDWSYNLLPGDEQALFRRLSVFVGGWTLGAAEEVCADELLKSEDILNLLEHLINKSLVVTETPGEARYSMLETLKQYANEKLIELGESEILRDKHLEHFHMLVETAEPFLRQPEQLEWLPILDANYKNIRFALEWALTKKEAEAALTMCWALDWYWEIRNYTIEAVGWLTKALAKTPHGTSNRKKLAYARALYTYAHFAGSLGNVEQVISSAEKSLMLASEAASTKDLAIARYYLATAIATRDGDFEQACSLLEQSSSELQELGELFWQARVFFQVGDMRTVQGKLKYRETALKKVELARRAGERLQLAFSLYMYAAHLFRDNEVEEAKACAQESEMLYKQLGSENSSTNSLLFAAIAWVEGDTQKARSLCVELKERFQLIGDKFWLAQAIQVLGLLYLEENDLAQAQENLEQALILAQELGNRLFITVRLTMLSQVFYQQGNMEGFKRKFFEMMTLKDSLTDYHKISILITLLGTFYRQYPECSAHLLGIVDHQATEGYFPLGPLEKHRCAPAEAYAREFLGETGFASTFAAGQKISVEEAFDLVMKIVEAM